MKSYLFNPANKAAVSLVEKLIAGEKACSNFIKLTKAEMQAYMNDVTTLNTSQKPLITAMNDTRVSH